MRFTKKYLKVEGQKFIDRMKDILKMNEEQLEAECKKVFPGMVTKCNPMQDLQSFLIMAAYEKFLPNIELC
jgi:hypothetical protein